MNAGSVGSKPSARGVTAVGSTAGAETGPGSSVVTTAPPPPMLGEPRDRVDDDVDEALAVDRAAHVDVRGSPGEPFRIGDRRAARQAIVRRNVDTQERRREQVGMRKTENGERVVHRWP